MFESRHKECMRANSTGSTQGRQEFETRRTRAGPFMWTTSTGSHLRMNGDKGLGSCRKGRHIASSHDLAVLEGTHEVAEISKTLEERPRREPNWQRNIFDNVSTASKRESFRKARAVITIENQRKSQSSSPYSPNIF
jgi:hypothetical protein